MEAWRKNLRKSVKMEETQQATETQPTTEKTPENTTESSGKKRYKVVYNRPDCIGAAACVAIDPKRWVMNEDGKADLISAKEVKPGIWELEIEAEALEINKDSAEGCPVAVIQIFDMETGEKLI